MQCISNIVISGLGNIYLETLQITEEFWLNKLTATCLMSVALLSKQRRFILSAQTGAYCDQDGLQEILNYVADIGRDVAGLFDAAGLDRRDVPDSWSATMLEKFAEPLEKVDFKGLIERFFFVGFTSGVLGNNWREQPCYTLH